MGWSRTRWVIGTLALACGEPAAEPGDDSSTSASVGPESGSSANAGPTTEPGSTDPMGTSAGDGTSTTTSDGGETTGSSTGASSSAGDTSGSSGTTRGQTSTGTDTDTDSGSRTSSSDSESSTGASSSSSTGGGVCGDGALDLGEDCDDGNLVGGDGCEDDCTSSDDVLPEWTLELGGPTGFVDVGSGVAFDSVGNLIVSAYTEPDVIWIRKYDTAYNELWTVTYPGIPGSAYSRVRVAVDGNDNIGFSGDVPDAGVSIKFGMLTPGGVELWTQTVGPGLDAGVDFDPNGNLLLAGAFLQASTDVWVAKYDPLGIEFWSDTYDSAGGSADAARTVASDPFGNVLVIGVANAPGDTHIVVRKYDPNGVVQWTDLVDGAAGESDWGWGVAVAANGDVLAGGVIRDVPLDGDGWLRRYEPGGTELWTQNYAGTANISGDGILDVATGAAGGIYVCGSIEDIGGQRYWVAKLDAAGQPVWERRKIESGQWLDVAVASDGRVAVAGTVNFPFPFDAEARFAVYPP